MGRRRRCETDSGQRVVDDRDRLGGGGGIAMPVVRRIRDRRRPNGENVHRRDAARGDRNAAAAVVAGGRRSEIRDHDRAAGGPRTRRGVDVSRRGDCRRRVVDDGDRLGGGGGIAVSVVGRVGACDDERAGGRARASVVRLGDGYGCRAAVVRRGGVGRVGGRHVADALVAGGTRRGDRGRRVVDDGDPLGGAGGVNIPVGGRV